MQNRIVLVAFYNVKALGVRYLETALTNAGYDVSTVFLKGFNSRNPKAVSEKELELLASFIKEREPAAIGLSVMSSMYYDTVEAVISKLKSDTDLPLIAGGAFASMYPEKILRDGCDYIIRSDGEIPMKLLADYICGKGGNIEEIPSISYLKENQPVSNPIAGLLENIDEYGLPAIECADACYIENDSISYGDPQLSTMSYEVIASRGCPFTCSYCCCINLSRLHPKGIKPVRTRSVKSVIDELVIAKSKLKKLVFVHFYDEIFPNTPGWVDEFIVEYKKKINLPFTIWSHPKMIDGEVLKKLVSVGLSEVIMGIQSGSDHIRKDVFHRYETREDIINSTKLIRESGVAWASYDFMVRHPFESLEDLKDTYYLVKELERPFELQIHGLNFLPGTDIVGMAIDQGLISSEEMDKIMFAPMAEQFGAYWKRENDLETRLWYDMIYCLQFDSLYNKIVSFEDDPMKHKEQIEEYYNKAQKLAKLSYLRKKSAVVLKSKTKFNGR